jgi:hypothetical protein
MSQIFIKLSQVFRMILRYLDIKLKYLVKKIARERKNSLEKQRHVGKTDKHQMSQLKQLKIYL